MHHAHSSVHIHPMTASPGAPWLLTASSELSSTWLNLPFRKPTGHINPRSKFRLRCIFLHLVQGASGFMCMLIHITDTLMHTQSLLPPSEMTMPFAYYWNIKKVHLVLMSHCQDTSSRDHHFSDHQPWFICLLVYTGICGTHLERLLVL